jgi:hypothetical protein
MRQIKEIEEKDKMESMYKRKIANKDKKSVLGVNIGLRYHVKEISFSEALVSGFKIYVDGVKQK